MLNVMRAMGPVFLFCLFFCFQAPEIIVLAGPCDIVFLLDWSDISFSRPARAEQNELVLVIIMSISIMMGKTLI